MTHIEEWMRLRYDASAKGYRKDDDLDVTGGDHQQVASRLSEICLGFDRKIDVLDIGCGTGRYFHALRNVRKLLGMDVSDEMLACAREPVKEEEMSVDQIELQRGNFYNHEFPDGSFDFIYAIGVFGNGCPITGEVLRKLFRWLRPGGRLFFDVLDSGNLKPVERFRKWARRSVYLALPPKLQQVWDKKTGWPPIFLISKRGLTRGLKRAGFATVSIDRQFTRLPLGDAWKHQSLAMKASQKIQP